MSYRLVWIAVWAAVGGLIFGFGAKRWSDRQGPFRVEASLELPETDYRLQWPSRVDALPERLRDFLMEHRQVDWLPLLGGEDEEVIYLALSGMAEKGDGEAALLAGLMKLRREGGDAESVLQLEVGADLGNSESQFLLGELVLVVGAEGVEKDKAMKHLELAAATKEPGARVLLAVVHQQEGRPVMAQQLISQAAADGEPEALYHAALFIWNAVGRKPDERGLFLLLQSAAETGDLRAMHALGVCYESRIGVEPSFADAKKWNRVAAEMGYEPARVWCAARAL